MATAPKTGGIHAPVTPSPELAAIVGPEPLPLPVLPPEARN